MLQVTPYCRMPLRVWILDEDAQNETLPKLQAAVDKLPKHITITNGNFDDLERSCADQMMEMHRPVASSDCAVCEKAFCNDDRVVSCPDCDTPFHVRCAAQLFVCNNHQKHNICLVPKHPAACSSC